MATALAGAAHAEHSVRSAASSVLIVPTTPLGEIAETVLAPVGGKDLWRLVVEVRAQPGAVVELQAHIAGYDRRLTETWAYQWIDA